jgi:hypothetical protein
MDDSVELRDAASETLQDIDPPSLRETLQQRIEQCWLVPGELTVLAARKAGVDEVSAGLQNRAVAVQLVYEGLALTRRLVHEEPWLAEETDAERGDIDIIAADILVARGAYLLARTEAVDKGVEIIQEFGRNQTDRPKGDPGRELEADIFELAAVAGSTTEADEPPAPIMAWSRDLGEEIHHGDLPDLSTLLARGESTASTGTTAMANDGRPGHNS